jgi:DNA-directed RNA polymerase subunit alpha
MPVGTIPVDSIFTPIRKVNFAIEPIHIGHETSRERLLLEMWTDGTISPVDAVSHAASILVGQLSPFVEYIRVSQIKAEEQLIRLSIPDEKYNMPVEQLDLSVRTMNCLRRGGIATVGELIGKKAKELLQLRNFGQKSFQEIEERLKKMGLSLAPQVELKKETEEAPQKEAPPEPTPLETETEGPAGSESQQSET